MHGEEQHIPTLTSNLLLTGSDRILRTNGEAELAGA